MATTLFSPISTLSVTTKNRDLGFLSKSSFLMGSLPFPSSYFSHHGKPTFSRRCFKSPRAQKSFSDHVPKQFRQENLEEGLMDNFENASQSIYGLSPPQLNLFMTEDNPVSRLSGKVTQESLSSANSYLHTNGMQSLRGMSNSGQSTFNRSGGGVWRAPPDLPSFLLANRIVYLGLPIIPEVAKLLIAEFMWLDYYFGSTRLYLFINCSGTQNSEGETVGSETDAYSIADAMSYCKADIYTLNLGMAYGQAAMLLSQGTKGGRFVMPNSFTKLYLPNHYRSSGAVSDMYIEAKELEANSVSYIELLAKGTGKSQEELVNDMQSPQFFQAVDAIEYGIADHIDYGRK